MSEGDVSAPITELSAPDDFGSRGRAEDFTGKPLGKVVKALYGVSDEEVKSALAVQRETGRKLGDVLVDRGVISAEQLSACLAILVKKETTFLSHAFLSPLKRHWWGRHTQLTLESFVVTLVTLALVYRILGLDESGLISIFLATAALTTRFNVVLADVDVRNEAVDILAMFIGMFLVFVGVGFVGDSDSLRDGFGFVLDIAHINPASTLYERNFGDLRSILFHNSMVLCSICLLAFFYRGYAALLTLAWNACVWGLTLTLLFKQSFTVGGADPLVASLMGIVAILPHLMLEAGAYIIGAVAAIGVSKALLWHRFMAPRFRLEIRRSALVMLGALVVLLLAGLCESYWAPHVLGIIRSL